MKNFLRPVYSMKNLQRYVVSAMFISLCVVMPMVFHALPGAGNTFLPMHIPVLLCGLVVGKYYGFLTGMFGPLLSSFVRGMPQMAYVPVMMAELAVYGFVAGLIFCILRTKNHYFNMYVALVVAMVAGRIVAGVFRALFFMPVVDTTIMAWWVASYFVTSLPGIILQLIGIPIIVVSLERARVLRRVG